MAEKKERSSDGLTAMGFLWRLIAALVLAVGVFLVTRMA